MYNHSGCRLISKKIRSTEKNRRNTKYDTGEINAMYCLDHEKIVCRCGWEFGHHYGTDSKNFPVINRKREFKEVKKRKELFLPILSKLMNIRRACNEFGISYGVFYYWMKDKDFKNKVSKIIKIYV